MRKPIKLNHLDKQLRRYFTEPDHYLTTTKNSYLFRQGDQARELFIIISGKVMISKTSPDGKELTLRICGPGDLIGEYNLAEEALSYLVDAKVIEAGEVSVYNQKRLIDKLALDSDASLALVKLTNLQYRKDQTRFRDLVLYGKKGALYSTLIRLSNSYGQKTKQGIYLDVNLTNQEIANFCATSRESVNRMLNELKRKGVIGIERGQITIFDLNYLKTEINCENCPIVLCTIN